MNWKDKCVVARWLYANTAWEPQHLAAKLDTPLPWVLGILGLPSPAFEGLDAEVTYRGEKGKIHQVLDSQIAPSGTLIGIYRHGPRDSYVGLVDKSQIEDAYELVERTAHVNSLEHHV